MTTAATTLLGLALPVTGELSGTWGDTVNNSITSLLDTAVAGTTTLSTDADVTLTTTTLASNQARQAILLWTANGTTTRNITAPAQSKIYTVINASAGTQSIVLRGAGPTTGVTIVKGESAICAWNGSDFIKVSNASGAGTFTNLTVTGNTVLGDADTDTLTFGASFVTGTTLKTAKSDTNTLALAAYDVDGTAYTNLITLTASNTPTLALTSTGVGTINNMSIGATTASTGAFTTLSASSTVTLSGGTANGVAYLNGSKVVTTGSALTFDGTNLGIGLSTLDAKLNVNGYSGNGTLRIGGGTTGESVLYFADSGSGTGSYAGFFQYLHSSDNLVFGAAAAEQMRLTSTGLGIGTSSPAAKLDVLGSSGDQIRVRTAGTEFYRFGRNSGTGFLDFYGSQTGYQGYTFGGIDGTWMTINSSGNLGLGVTPSAWGSSSAIQMAGGQGYSRYGVTNNAYYDGSNYRYVATAAATLYGNNAGSHLWFTAASGTAGNAISFTQAMTLDASGKLGIGTSSPGAQLTVIGSAAKLYVDLSGDNYYDAANHVFRNFAGTERARIDSSGNLLVGKTADTNSLSGLSLSNNPSNGGLIKITRISGSTTQTHLNFFDSAGGQVGSITTTASSTAYNTSSDYRLKENIQPMTGALAKVAALKPVTYKWKADGSDGEGFIAHELAEVVPQCVTGEKDAVDEDGKPVYQGIDTSFLVATLTAALQEAVAEINQLKADVAALKGN